MTRRKFAIYSSLFTAAMMAFVVGFPFILVAIARMTHCAPDTCGAVGLVFGMYGRLLGVLIYGSAMLAVISARCRRAGLSSWWVVASLFWLLAARDVLIAGLNFWGVGFSLGILYLHWPTTLLFFAALVIFLSLWKGADEDGSELPRKSWRLAQGSGALSAIISVAMSIEVFVTIAWIAGFRSINPMSFVWLPQRFLYVRIGSHFITYSAVLWTLLAVFAGALAYVILTQRRQGHLAVPPIPPAVYLSC